MAKKASRCLMGMADDARRGRNALERAHVPVATQAAEPTTKSAAERRTSHQPRLAVAQSWPDTGMHASCKRSQWNGKGRGHGSMNMRSCSQMPANIRLPRMEGLVERPGEVGLSQEDPSLAAGSTCS
eukprot:362322-Chlamydomonas_euryale.AAC.11